MATRPGGTRSSWSAKADGSAHWVPIRVPYTPSWWDGKDDGKYWRVSYIVPNLTIGLSADGLLEHSTYRYIVLKFKDDVPWSVPGWPFGIGHASQRGLKPASVAFVKEEGSAHFSFEPVLKSLFVSPRAERSRCTPAG